MKVTGSGKSKHRQLRNEGYPQKEGICGTERICGSVRASMPDILVLWLVILLVGCKLWKRRIPNGTYGGVGGRLLK